MADFTSEMNQIQSTPSRRAHRHSGQ